MGPGRGAEFVLRLPMLKEKPKPEETPPLAGKKSLASNRRILVVDDNRDSAESLAMLLEMNGNEHVAYDSLEAVEAAKRFHPDLVLLDIGLPKLNGYDVCRLIRPAAVGQKRDDGGRQRLGQEQDRRKSQAAGFDHHLIKPVDLTSLMKLLA